MSYKDKAQEKLFEQIKIKQRMVLKNPVKRKQQILRTSVTRGIFNDKMAKWNTENNQVGEKRLGSIARSQISKMMS